MGTDHWKTLNSQLAFENPWFKVQRDEVELPSGRRVDDYFMWLSGNIALIVALTPQNELVLVRQYKHAVGQVMIELPGGLVDGDENPVDAAVRELREETGYVADKAELLARLSDNPTKQVGNLFIGFAENVRLGPTTSPDDNEQIEILTVGLSTAVNMVLSGEIWATGSVAGILLAALKLST